MALALGPIAVPTVSGASGTTAIETLGGTFTGFNNFTSANNSFYLGQVLNQIWPAPYFLGSNAKFALDKYITTAASSSVVNGKQVVTYTINPKAVWSDNTPITADDFIYMFQASSGDPQYTDIDGTPYDVAGTAGYEQIESVVGSNPAATVTYPIVKGHPKKTVTATPCALGSIADRNLGLCPNGQTVTVTFQAGKPYAEWQGLFGLLPAHIARTVGWNTGMDDPATAPQHILSAGPYVLSNVDQANNTYTETKNPKWWGKPANIDTLVFTNLADDTQGIAGLGNGDFQVFQPTTPTVSQVNQSLTLPDIQKSIVPAYTFEHLDFNITHSTYMANVNVRKAIALGISRTDIISATVGQVSKKIKPLDNYIFMSNQPGYVADGAQYDNGGSATSRATAINLLKGVDGLYLGSDNMFHTGSATGPVLSFVLQEKGNTTRTIEAQIIQGDLKKIGIDVQIVVRSNSTLPDGNFDMVIFGWAGSPLLSGFLNIYGCTNDSNNVCQPNASNYGHFSDSTVSGQMSDANSSTTLDAEQAGYKTADVRLWTLMPTLPLYQSPQAAFWINVSGVKNNPTQAGISWNAQAWTRN